MHINVVFAFAALAALVGVAELKLMFTSVTGRMDSVFADFCDACSHTAIHQYEDKLYCFGGGKKGSSYLLTMSSKLSISSGRPMPCLPRTLNATCIANNRLYSFGGCESMLNIHDGLLAGNIISVIDLVENKYCEIYLSGVRVPGLVGAALIPAEKKLLLCGGADSTGRASNICYSIDTATYNVSVYCEFPNPGIGTSFTLADTKVYAFGGQTARGCSNTLYVLDTAKDTATRQWELVKTLHPAPKRYCHSACMHEGYLIIFGGRTESRILSDMWMFVPQSSAWYQISCPPSLGGRYSAPMCSLDSKLLIAGGIGPLTTYGMPFTIEPVYKATRSPIKQVSII